MHRLLLRQLKRHGVHIEEVPENIRGLLRAVDDAYTESDEDRAMLERAFEISSRELMDTNSKLKDALSHFEAVMEHSPFVAMQGFDRNGAIIHWNSASKRLYGYDSSEAIGKRIQDLILPKEAVMGFEKTLNDVWVTGKPSNPSEWQIRNRLGETRWVYSTMFALLVKEQVVEIICVDVDITEKRKLEDQLLQAEKMKAMGTLAGGIAHDFNNLLMGIMGHASLMSMGMETSHPHYDRLKSIEDLVQSGALLTRQLLGFAQGGRYALKTIDLNQVIEKTSAMFGRTRKEIAIHLKSEENLWPTEADQGQMEQVLLNLLVNAWQSMPGGGDLYLETRNAILDDGYVESCGVPPGKYVKISITDSGTGMDKKTMERIFDPFFTTKEMGRGTGLGLSIVYGIVKGHKGFINVYSEKGHGTTFNIYLPASGKEVVPEISTLPEIIQGTGTILLADDELPILNASQRMLERLGYKVLAAQGGKEALALYEDRKDEIDIVLLDMIMPEVSGEKVFQSLREKNPRVKVILLSGYSINGQAARILENGCNGFLQKPVSLSELSKKIHEVLSTKSP